MSTEWFEDYTISAIAPYDSKHAFFLMKDRDLEESEIQHSVFIEYNSGGWREIDTTNWECAGICIPDSPKVEMLAIGANGEIAFSPLGGTISESQIEPTPFLLRTASKIENKIFACGMRREVYRQSINGKWQQIFTSPTKKGELSGFEALAGFTEENLYTAGWHGEIWHFNGALWRQIDSPTNQILTGATCSTHGEVYICGRNGTLLKGHGDIWKNIEPEPFNDDFWSITEHQGSIYASTMSEVYILKDDNLTPINWGVQRPTTCYRLVVGGGSLWSVGANDAWVNNGTNWIKVL